MAKRGNRPPTRVHQAPLLTPFLQCQIVSSGRERSKVAVPSIVYEVHGWGPAIGHTLLHVHGSGLFGVSLVHCAMLPSLTPLSFSPGGFSHFRASTPVLRAFRKGQIIFPIQTIAFSPSQASLMSHGSDSSSETYHHHAVPWVRSPLSLANKLDLKELKDPEEPLHA